MTFRKTSLRAYQEIEASGILSRRRWQAYDGLFRHGPCTAMELCVRAGIPGLWKRLSELERYGVAEVVGERTCTVTGYTVTEWDVTDVVPGEAEPSRVAQGSLF